MAIINIMSKLQIFIFIIRIGNLLINSSYGATDTCGKADMYMKDGLHLSGKGQQYLWMDSQQQ